MNIHEWIENNLSKDSVVVEGGLHLGKDTEFFCEYFNKGKIYGFEPIPILFEAAKKRVERFKNVTLYKKGLSDKSGTSIMHVSEINNQIDQAGSSSLLPPKIHLSFHPDVKFNNTINIETINLDDWFLETKPDKIDFMWLDIQGVEPLVLAAAPIILSKTKYLYTEVSHIEMYENAILYPEFKIFLENSNFEMLFEDFPWKDMGNVLFRNKDG